MAMRRQKSIDRSLENLGLDYIDLYLIHQMIIIAALDTGKGTHDRSDPANAQRLSAFRIHD